MPYANSWRFTFPATAYPPSSSSSTARALRTGTCSAKIAEPYVVVSPAVSKRSLIATGVPGPGSSGRASQVPSTEATLLLVLRRLLRRLDRHVARDRGTQNGARRGHGCQRQDVGSARRASEPGQELLRDRELEVVVPGPQRPRAE